MKPEILSISLTKQVLVLVDYIKRQTYRQWEEEMANILLRHRFLANLLQ